MRRPTLKGSSWIGPAPLLLSVAVNLYVIIYLTMLHRGPSQPSHPAAETQGHASDPRVLLSRAPQALPERLDGRPEVWASGTLGSRNTSVVSELLALLTSEERKQLRELCGRCLFQTLTTSITVRDGIADSVFVATGDIPDEWIRDGSVQLGVYLPRLGTHPVLRRVVEGAIKTQAYYILSDPWANSYRKSWAAVEQTGKFERQIGRGGWIATRNFEVDSGAYFMNLLWNYATTPGIWAAETFLNDTMIHDAVCLMIKTWAIEQHHEQLSPYRYAELPREGRGAETNYTGMIWSGFRPSDDPNTYGYNVPVNMYAAGALERVARLNELVWRDPALGQAARKMAEEVQHGIDTYGVVLQGGAPAYYAYEVDGLGNQLTTLDDPNVPSLLSMPVLGYAHYDERLYAATRARIFSKANTHYFEGSKLRGCGSPHTPDHYVWSLAHCMQALTSNDTAEIADVMRQLLQMQGANGLMHESNDVNHPDQLTRPLFQWANTMFVVLYEQTFGEECTQVAEALRIQRVEAREKLEKRMPRNGGPDLAAYYDRLEQSIHHEG